jgi:Spy/CpxP family protein refolding chaperone
MIHRPLALAVLALFVFARSASAQDAKTSAAPSPAAPKTKSLWDYKTELGLSDDQIAKIKNEVRILQEELAVDNKTVELSGLKLQRLAESDGDIKDIREELHKIADAQVDARVADIQTSRTVNKILTAEQQKKWRALQAANRPAAK